MNKIFQLSTLTLALASANAFAHHPAADIVDPEIYAMIEENISEVHLAMTFDDMGGNSPETDTAMGGNDEAGSMVAEMGSDLADVGAAMEAGSGMGGMSDIESGGQMNGQR